MFGTDGCPGAQCASIAPSEFATVATQQPGIDQLLDIEER